MTKKELKKTRQYLKVNSYENAYVCVPLSWCARFDLSPTELLIFCYIRHRTEKYVQKAYTGSVKGLSVIANCSLPTARKALQTLCDKGFIIKTHIKRDTSTGKTADWVSYESRIPSNIGTNSKDIEERLAVTAIVAPIRK